MEPKTSVRALAGTGLEGDRYAAGIGHYSGDLNVSRGLTLIEGEVIDAVRAEAGIVLQPGESRRNLTTRGLRLNPLVGRRFWVGRVLCLGTKLCEPCRYLVDVVGKPVLRPLVHRGGLRADILTDGVIQVGDRIAVAEPAEIVIGTRNPAKASQCELALRDLDVRARLLSEMLSSDTDVPETDRDPLANARNKALRYAATLRMPVLSLDFALRFEGIPDDLQPNHMVRRISGDERRQSDDELLLYYASLIERHGGRIKGRWNVGIAVVTPDEVHETRVTVDRTFVSTASASVIPGYPLASLQLAPDGRHIADVPAGALTYPEVAGPLRRLVALAVSRPPP